MRVLEASATISVSDAACILRTVRQSGGYTPRSGASGVRARAALQNRMTSRAIAERIEWHRMRRPQVFIPGTGNEVCAVSRNPELSRRLKAKNDLDDGARVNAKIAQTKASLGRAEEFACLHWESRVARLRARSRSHSVSRGWSDER
jgi:hypothetical protein